MSCCFALCAVILYYNYNLKINLFVNYVIDSHVFFSFAMRILKNHVENLMGTWRELCEFFVFYKFPFNHLFLSQEAQESARQESS